MELTDRELCEALDQFEATMVEVSFIKRLSRGRSFQERRVIYL